MTCPLQAKFKYLDKLPSRQSAAASYGSCVHHALNIYNQTNDLDKALLAFIENWEHPEKLGVVPEDWPKGSSFGGYRQRGIDTLRGYAEHLRWDDRTVLATEHEFLVPFGEFELYGFIDLVELRGDELNIVDYKTNRRQPNLQALQQNIQFTTYTYAAMQPEFWEGTAETPPVHNISPPDLEGLRVRAIWYHLEKNKEIYAGPRGDQDFMRLYRACLEIKKALANDVFVPNISGDSCVWCSYTEPCGVTITPKEEVW